MPIPTPDSPRHEPEASGPDAQAGVGPSGEKAAELRSIIEDLHDGLPPDVAKARFDEVVRKVSPQELGAMEEQLIREGMPVEEIQRLCDLHVSIVQGSLERQEDIGAPPGHPVHTYRANNAVITEVANRLGGLCASVHEREGEDSSWTTEFQDAVEKVAGVNNQYLRKENELFPALERHGITGPSRVMWGVHDEIRALIKEARATIGGSPERAGEAGAALARAVVEMVYKENKILLPLALETLSEADWADVRRGEDELGYAFVEPKGTYPLSPSGSEADSKPDVRPDPNAERPAREPGPGAGPGIGLPIVSAAPTAPLPETEGGYLDLGTGQLSLEQVDMILRHLPVDLSFVDADGFVRYYSETEERLFPRTPGAIGRHVTNCHPQKSVHMVEEILQAFSAGEREVAEFWIEMQGRFIHIRYFAVRTPSREYLGCLEVSQDVTEIRALEGQRRLLEWS
jgi:DUF438 domain-containing protein